MVGVRQDDVPLQDVAGTSTGLHTRQWPNSAREKSRSSVLQSTVCSSRSSGAGVHKREQSEGTKETPSMSVGTSKDSRKYLHIPRRAETLPNLRSANRERTRCSSCGGRLHVVTCLPVHHPASGLWNSEMSPYVVAGFQAVAAY